MLLVPGTINCESGWPLSLGREGKFCSTREREERRDKRLALNLRMLMDICFPRLCPELDESSTACRGESLLEAELSTRAAYVMKSLCSMAGGMDFKTISYS